MDGEMLEQELAEDPDGPLHIDCIESPYYAEVRSMVNVKLSELLAELQGGDFNGGDLAIKLSLELADRSKDIVVQDEAGEAAESAYYYKNPVLDYAVAVTLKKTSKDKARKTDTREFKLEDGRFLAVPVKTPQITMAELAAHRRDEP